MAFTVHPTGSASGFSEESALDSELHRLLHSLGDRMADFVVAPYHDGHFDITTSGSSYDVDVAAGDGFFGGHFVRSDATTTLTLDGSTTNEIFIVVDDARTDNAAIEYTSDGTTPSGQYVMKIWEVTTDGSGVTGTEDFRKYVAFSEEHSYESITGQKTGTTSTVATDVTGVVTVDHTFDHSYPRKADSVVATLNTLSDTSVAFAWIRTTNVTVDGFTVEARINNAGSSGSTADFLFQATGK
jgi:FlaG/FlaF family flagellin (archaellin)